MSAFDDIKQTLVSLDVMAFPTNDGEFILDTDASDETIGVMVTQIQTGVERKLPMVAEPQGSSCRTIV